MKAILFDFDGTLVDTQVLYNIAISKTLTPYNQKFTVEYCSQFFDGKCWNDAFDIIAIEENFHKETIFNKGLTLAREIIAKHAKPTDGTPETLALLKSKGVKMAICSNSHRDEIRAVLKQTGLDDFFDDALIFGRDLVSKGKPSSDIYLLGLEAFGVAPQNAIAIEDSINGARASLNANIPTAIFTGSTSFHGMSSFKKAFQEDLPHFNNMKEIVQYVGHW